MTVTGVDDFVDRRQYRLHDRHRPGDQLRPQYNGLDASDVSVTNTDNDTAGITVSPTSGLTTTEAGGTATFTVVLTSQPTADVTIASRQSDTTEGTVSPGQAHVHDRRTGTSPQTVTVTGVDDFVDDGDIAYSIVTAPATSGDLNYNGLNAADVVGHQHSTTTRRASPSARPAGLITTEAGGTATFTVVLNIAADGRRDHRAVLERHDRRHGRAGQPDVHVRQLERAADRHRHRRRRRLDDGASPTRSSPRRRPAPTPATAASTPRTSRSPTPTTTRPASRSPRPPA